MKLLVWDTSSKAGAVAAAEWDPSSREGRSGVRLLGELGLNVDAQHSEGLLWGVDQLLHAVRWRLQEVDLFAVGVGPGSFTGLRIGITTARTLAHSLGKPLIGLSSLAALARPAAQAIAAAGQRSVVVAATDACKGECFALVGSARSAADCVALAEGDHPGLWKRGVEEEVLSPEALVQHILKKLTPDSCWTFVGEARRRYPEIAKALPRGQELDPGLAFGDQIQGRQLAMMAWEAAQAGLARDPLTVHPRYLRASDAEVKLKAGLLPPGPTRGDRGN